MIEKNHIKLQIFEFIILVATISGLFLWCRSESRNDYRELERWTKDMLSSIQAEIKDFHGRLCALEERSRGENK